MNREQIADLLDQGSSADIFFDYDEFGDTGDYGEGDTPPSVFIPAVIEAMTEAAGILRQPYPTLSVLRCTIDVPDSAGLTEGALEKRLHNASLNGLPVIMVYRGDRKPLPVKHVGEGTFRRYKQGVPATRYICWELVVDGQLRTKVGEDLRYDMGDGVLLIVTVAEPLRIKSKRRELPTWVGTDEYRFTNPDCKGVQVERG